jgi:hypothetical protein
MKTVLSSINRTKCEVQVLFVNKFTLVAIEIIQMSQKTLVTSSVVIIKTCNTDKFTNLIFLKKK